MLKKITDIDESTDEGKMLLFILNQLRLHVYKGLAFSKIIEITNKQMEEHKNGK